MHPIRLLLTGRADPYLWGLHTFLVQQPNVAFVGLEPWPHSLAVKTLQASPQLLLASLPQPIEGHLHLLHALYQKYPPLPLIAFAQFNQEKDMSLALQGGARGFLHKECTVKEITEAIETVLDGQVYYCYHCRELLTRRLQTGGAKAHDATPSPIRFTRQEEAIIQLVCEENGNKQIAYQLNLSVNSIERWLKKIRDKMGVRSVSGIVLYAVRNGLYGRTG
jgi:DNA-binding NarL/FixJ family response regulator